MSVLSAKEKLRTGIGCPLSREGLRSNLITLGTSIVLEGVHHSLEEGHSDQAELIVLPDDLG